MNDRNELVWLARFGFIVHSRSVGGSRETYCLLIKSLIPRKAILYLVNGNVFATSEELSY